VLKIHNDNVNDIQFKINTDKETRLEHMSEAELDEKIKVFRGRNNEIDEVLHKKIGKLLIDESEEAINASSETFQKLYALIGGHQTIMIIAGS